MTWWAFSLVLVSAICHASWNTAAKKISSNITIPWIGMFSFSLLLSPLLFFITIKSWKVLLFWAGAAAIVHGVYFLSLMQCNNCNPINYCKITSVFPTVALQLASLPPGAASRFLRARTGGISCTVCTRASIGISPSLAIHSWRLWKIARGLWFKYVFDSSCSWVRLKRLM